MDIEDIYSKIKELEKIHSGDSGVEKEILGIHEAATKLWQALNKTDEEKRKRIASVFIGAFVAASKLDIGDIAKVIEDRIRELNKELKGK